MVKCQHCGTPNRADASYCNTCGYALKGATVVHPAASAARGTTAGPLHPTGRLPSQSRLAGCYIISRTIGQGGMAAVYQATDIRNQSQVAIKEMSQDSLAPSELKEALDSFVQEAELLMSLRHKGLPRVSGHFSEGSRHYLVMEYIEGKTLEQRLTAAGGKALPEREVVAWADQIADVLTYLHNRRPPVIFRDLKPANIMVTNSGRIKLIDFGIARVFVPGRTRDTQVLGTPGFAPPEQYGKAQTDPRADVYALGCTLYQLLSGYDPASTPFALPPLNTRNPSVSPHVQVAIERATKLDREARFRTAADFQRALTHPEGIYFRTGECAHSLRELVALCQAHPQEAAEHLYARRFDSWLSRWGERQAAKAVLTATMRTADQAAGLAAFLKDATAPAASASSSARPSAQAARQRAGQPARSATTHAASAAPSATAPLVVVQPRTIDFGQLKAGQQGAVSITINGQNGASVNGQIIPPPTWITLDKTSFSGPSTLVQLTAETARIAGRGKQYSSLQIVTGTQHIYVPITAEIVRAPRATTAPQSSASYATQTARGTATPVLTHAKYAAPPVTASNLGFVGGLMLALGLSAAAVQFVPSLAAIWAPGLAVGAPLMLALLALVALVALAGALIGSGGKSWPGRIKTTLAGALIGALVALVVGHQVLLAGFTLPRAATSMTTATQPIWANPALFNGHPSLPGVLLLAAAIISLGATLGATRLYSGIMLRIGAFFRRYSALFAVLGGILGGGVGAGLLVSQWPPLIPISVVAGAIFGGIICARINQMFEHFARARYLNSFRRSTKAQAGRPRTKGYP
ncbi:MAG TPA: serine/threonine-protein kinase [Ktedonobacterales bacterium]|nr:serine/threonine-protein kinase [Ktedonobacterales bacterium]